ncbi:MAG TPA: hypothetical protein P5052_03875 [Candidatus Paceibacterota bacterium]|nr:hypothetical protein [Candidatus Paceibacterota bacterium]HRZ29851.1 hypothetical protein [Candidatus Paceibacterota bacterium]
MTHEVLDKAIESLMVHYPGAVSSQPIPAIPIGIEKDVFLYEVIFDFGNKKIIFGLFFIESVPETFVVTLREFSKDSNVDSIGVLGINENGKLIFLENPGKHSENLHDVEESFLKAIDEAEKSC